jgi:MinD superfamily P-loop ATPase
MTLPTPFGLNDLKLAVELVRRLNLPFAVAIKYDGIGNRDVAETYSSGQTIVGVLDSYRRRFLSVYDYLERAKVRLDKTRCVRVRR